MQKLRVGLIGLGRLGHLYAHFLSSRISGAQLFAVAGHCAPEIAELYGVPFHSIDRLEVINHPHVEAIIICSSTDTHVQFILEAFKVRKPVFCEKPLALELADTTKLSETQGTTFFQMGFMRRFDPSYLRARRKINDGSIGEPILFKATSRDKTRTSLEYAKTSGGLLMDMGIHDFDMARFLVGDIKSVQTIGKRLLYPELAEVNDIDQAIVTLQFQQALGVIDVSRNAGFGYDVETEVLGHCGSIRIGALQGTTMVELHNNSISTDTIPSFLERFEVAFVDQLQNFVNNILQQYKSPVTLQDGIEAIHLVSCAKESLEKGLPVQCH